MNKLPDSWTELVTVKELAARIKYAESAVWQMRRRGFQMIAGRSTVEMAMEWLAVNGKPWAGEAKRRKTKASAGFRR